jgi:hypothetical protein
MIKFFRKIRQNLLSQGKTGKYFKYAIGEIVLVVIGILIALSINSWNSDRLQNSKNRQLLLKMSKELDQHSERMTLSLDSSRAFKFRLIYIDSVSNILDKGIQPNDFEYLVKAPRYYTITLNLNTVVFEELINTGSLYALGTDSLVTNIQNYYQRCEKEKFYNLEFGKTVLDLQKPCFDGFFDFAYWHNKNPEKAIALHPWIFDPQSDHYRSFRNYNSEFKRHNSIMVWKLESLINYCDELKRAINNEIGQLSN